MRKRKVSSERAHADTIRQTFFLRKITGEDKRRAMTLQRQADVEYLERKAVNHTAFTDFDFKILFDVLNHARWMAEALRDCRPMMEKHDKDLAAFIWGSDLSTAKAAGESPKAQLRA